MADDTKTAGYLERRILHRMRVTSSEKPSSYFFAINASDVEGWHGASAAAVRRAFQSLHEKGLITPVEEAPDPTDNRRYDTVSPSEDGRVQDWTLTMAGDEEIKRLESEYFDDLEALLKRYGRHRAQLTERFE